MQTTLQPAVLPQLSVREFLKLVNPVIHPNINTVAQRPGCEALVCFENQQMDASQYGSRTIMGVGEGFTYKLEDITPESKIGQTPSVFKYAVSVLVLSGDAKKVLKSLVR